MVGVPRLAHSRLPLPGTEQDKGRDCTLRALGGTAGSRISELAGDNDRKWWGLWHRTVCRPKTVCNPGLELEQ